MHTSLRQLRIPSCKSELLTTAKRSWSNEQFCTHGMAQIIDAHLVIYLLRSFKEDTSLVCVIYR